MKIAIHPDDYTPAGAPDEADASSPRWARALESAGHEVVWVDARKPGLLEQVRDCDGFMWRWAHFGGMSRIARRLLPVIEGELGLCTYPDQKTCWHYDDKIAQAFLLEALDVPTPRTWVFFDRDDALQWAYQSAAYPLVIKLATGAGSTNVQRVDSAPEARSWIERMFSQWQISLAPSEGTPSLPRRIAEAAKLLATGTSALGMRGDREPQRGYALFQEFLPDNTGDTRITVIGNRAFGFRRKNRPGDFRASGSGQLDHDPESIDPNAIRLGFATAAALQAQSVAIDGLEGSDGWVVGEVSYTYASDAVHACPGHWKLDGSPQTGRLDWVDGAIWPEQAQIEDYLVRLNAHVRPRRD